MRPVVGCSNPARMRNSVLFPDPLSPSRVRNSPCSTSSEIDSSTACSPKRLLTPSRLRKPLMLSPSLAGLYFVPYLGMFRPSRHILPKHNLMLICIDIVQVQAVALLRRHQRGGLGIGREISRNTAQLLLRLGGNEVIQQLVSEFLVLARRRNHQVVDPSGCAFRWNLLLNR